jgi:hypothetical protein
MPWLVQEQDAPSPEEAVLFVHIPRSGGTSLNADYNVPAQTKRGRHCMHRALLTYFFYRYKLLERSNFPFRSWENLYVACSLSVAVIIGFLFTIAPRLKGEIWYHPLDCVHMGLCTLPYVMIGSASLTFFLNTFVATAPSLRSDNLRRFYLWFWHLTGAYSTSVISGTNKNGFLMHLTAEEMVRHGYVTEAQLMRVSSFAIVRNPFARMVSVYMYNRLGRLESFKLYIRRCYRAYQKLNERGQWGTIRAASEWGVYCHRLPMHSFTHDRDRQLVGHVVRMEEIALLKAGLDGGKGRPRILARDSRRSELPPAALKAITGMSRVNARPLAQPWQEYYDAETTAMVLEMYARDFELFGYPTTVPTPPPRARAPSPAAKMFAGRSAAIAPVSEPAANTINPACAPAPSAGKAGETATLTTGEPLSFPERMQKWWAHN